MSLMRYVDHGSYGSLFFINSEDICNAIRIKEFNHVIMPYMFYQIK